MIDDIIFQLLILDGNETHLIKDYYNGLVYDDYRGFMLELIKKKYDVRFCNLSKCVCHPEHKLRQYLDNEDLMNFLKDCMGGYFNKMIDIIKEDYKGVDIFEDTKLRNGVETIG